MIELDISEYSIVRSQLESFVLNAPAQTQTRSRKIVPRTLADASNKKSKIQSSIILSGPIGSGKTKLVEEVAKNNKCIRMCYNSSVDYRSSSELAEKIGINAKRRNVLYQMEMTDKDKSKDIFLIVFDELDYLTKTDYTVINNAMKTVSNKLFNVRIIFIVSDAYLQKIQKNLCQSATTVIKVPVLTAQRITNIISKYIADESINITIIANVVRVMGQDLRQLCTYLDNPKNLSYLPEKKDMSMTQLDIVKGIVETKIDAEKASILVDYDKYVILPLTHDMCLPSVQYAKHTSMEAVAQFTDILSTLVRLNEYDIIQSDVAGIGSILAYSQFRKTLKIGQMPPSFLKKFEKYPTSLTLQNKLLLKQNKTIDRYKLCI